MFAIMSIRAIQALRLVGLGACLTTGLMTWSHLFFFDELSWVKQEVITAADSSSAIKEDAANAVQDVRIQNISDGQSELRQEVSKLRDDHALLKEALIVVQTDMNHGKWLISAVTLSVLAQLTEMLFRILQRRREEDAVPVRHRRAET